MPLPTEFIAFSSRKERSRYVANRFSRYLDQSVLDVGCYEADVGHYLKNPEYTGVDIVGKPDIEVNLEEAKQLPFADNSFKTAICIEVLEHLDNLHRVFSELVRVADEYVIISLPNCWRSARRPISRGRGEFIHYGLPVNRPLDRHKWFFNVSQAQNFLAATTKDAGLQIEELFVTEKPKNQVIRTLRKARFPDMRYQNRYAQTIWSVIRT